jgi:tetratricopeptide (TPR) repeat protein
MTRWLVILFLTAARLTRADSAVDKLAPAGVTEFTAAYQAWDGARFGAVAELFRQATTHAPASATNFYWLGVAQFHRMLQIQNQPAPPTNTSAAPAAMDAAIAALSRAVKLDPRHAESHALLGTLYGMKIGSSTVRAAWFGPRVANHRTKATKLGLTNPRVQYLLGTCQFHTAKKPAALREALATLLKAEKLFEAEGKVAPGPLDPRWGHDSCLTFIGRTYELLGQRKEAVDYFRKALAMHPTDHLAKEGLERVSEDK